MRHPEDGPKTMIQMAVDPEPGEKPAHQVQEGARAAECVLAFVCFCRPGLRPLESKGKGHVSTLGLAREPVWPGQCPWVSPQGRAPFSPVLEVRATHEAGHFPGASTALSQQPPGQHADHSNMGRMHVPPKDTGAGQER